MKKHVLLMCLFIAGMSFCVHAINFSRVNIAWQYDPDFDHKMKHRVVKDQTGLYVFLLIQSDSLRSWSYQFLLQEGYLSESHREISSIESDTLSKDSNQVLLKLFVDPVDDENLLVIKFSKPGAYYYYDVRLKIGSLAFPAIYPVAENGEPILDNYINRSSHYWIGHDTLLAQRYPEIFPPADPPMADMKPIAPKISADSSFYFSGTPDFKENYFYSVREDSLANVAVTFLRTPPYYPEYRQLGELMDALAYIITEQERKALLRAGSPKKAFDSFWMNTYVTKTRAREAIRIYYDWVEEANVFFTDFMPGWKTDRGMIYIVFGKPDEVYRMGSVEEWYYDDGAAFEFTIISTFFAPQTYSLRRSKDLEEIWYTKIAAIRRGIYE